MKNNVGLKIGLALVGAIVGFFLLKWLFLVVIGTALKIAIPVIIVGAIGYVGYRYVTKSSALPGRRRTPLP